MKTQPSSYQVPNPSLTDQLKSPYSVCLDGQIFTTYAHNEAGAITNVAYRYGIQEHEDVKLIMWKIKQKELSCEVSKL
jgi:hypothetical protein